MNINDEWENFKRFDENDEDEEEDQYLIKNEKEIVFDISDTSIPKASNIYISTKTKIAYLTSCIDLKKMFWSIPVIPYAQPSNGVIKKQKKFNSLVIEELDYIKEKLQSEKYFEEHIITSINKCICSIMRRKLN